MAWRCVLAGLIGSCFHAKEYVMNARSFAKELPMNAHSFAKELLMSRFFRKELRHAKNRRYLR